MCICVIPNQLYERSVHRHKFRLTFGFLDYLFVEKLMMLGLGGVSGVKKNRYTASFCIAEAS